MEMNDDMFGRDFSDCDLSDEDLSGEYLICANFRGGDLKRIDLRYVCLIEARFDRAFMEDANLTGAHLNDLKINPPSGIRGEEAMSK